MDATNDLNVHLTILLDAPIAEMAIFFGVSFLATLVIAKLF